MPFDALPNPHTSVETDEILAVLIEADRELPDETRWTKRSWRDGNQRCLIQVIIDICERRCAGRLIVQIDFYLRRVLAEMGFWSSPMGFNDTNPDGFAGVKRLLTRAIAARRLDTPTTPKAAPKRWRLMVRAEAPQPLTPTAWVAPDDPVSQTTLRTSKVWVADDSAEIPFEEMPCGPPGEVLPC